MAKKQPVQRAYTLEDFANDDLAQSIANYGVPQEDVEPAPQQKARGFARAAGDTALALGQGAIGAFKSLSDLAGASNPVSDTLQDASEFLQSPSKKQAKHALERQRSLAKLQKRCRLTWI